MSDHDEEIWHDTPAGIDIGDGRCIYAGVLNYDKRLRQRIVACVNALRGIGTEALEKIAALGDEHRFGGLSDLCKLHYLHAKCRRDEGDGGKGN